MKMTIAVIAPGAMGAATGRVLAEHGATVLTMLAGRSAASAARAAEAGMQDAPDPALGQADMVLSILPPGAAVALAQRLAPHLRAGTLYVDCNAVNPATMMRIAGILAPTPAALVDAGIIGGPPQPGKDGPVFYAAGDAAPRFAALVEYGLAVRLLDGGIGAASALKMSYGGITKGLTALASVMLLGATQAGVADALAVELAASQPALAAWFGRQIPGMPPKAYRWVAEMQEIAGFLATDAAGQALFTGAADFYAAMAEDTDGTKAAALRAFLARS